MNSRVSDEEITLHLGLSGLNISDLDKGLDTQIGSSGEAGHAISGGQLRKIALARAISSQPKFLIADEPTADMDDASSSVIMETLRQYAKNGAMVLCITHDLSLIEKGDTMISCLRGASR